MTKEPIQDYNRPKKQDIRVNTVQSTKKEEKHVV